MKEHLRVLSQLRMTTLLFMTCGLAFGQAAQSGGQAPATAGVPRLVKFSGLLRDAAGNLLGNTAKVTFSIYSEQTGGVPLWQETQNVQFTQGRYTVYLGQTRSQGIPVEIFSSGQSRWLGVRLLEPGVEEQPRTFLTSVPYALKAADADTLGGLPPSAFLQSNIDGSDVVLPSSSSTPSTSTAPSTTYLPVTTPGGTMGRIPEFSGSSVINNSPIRDANGEVVMKNLENVRFADQFSCPSSPGCGGKSDFGAQVNAAYASCPANGCTIRIPAGSYTVSTPIRFTTYYKPVVLECDAGSTQTYATTGVTTLHYTGTSGAAIIMSTVGGTGSGIRGCTLVGPGFGAPNTAIGLQLSFAVQQSYKDLYISGFNVGVQLGDWVYLDNFYNLQLDNNAKALFAPAGINTGTGESIAVFGGVFSNRSSSLPSFNTACVDFEGGQAVVVSFYSVSFDQCGVTLNIPGGQQFLFSGSHFEDPVAATGADFLSVGDNCVSCHIIISGSDMYETYPSSRNEFITLGGGARLTILGGIYLAAEPIPQVITSTHLANAVTVLGAEKVNAITAWVSGSYAAFTTIDPREYRPLTVAGGPIILGGNPSINGSITSAALSSSRTWSFPDSSGTVLLSDGSGNVSVSGRLSVAGDLNVTGAKHFKIDHPLDPANKYLYHTSVESPDMMNVYNGTTVLDSNGEADVQLPDWFEALNRDFKYQLTCIGGFAPVYIAREIMNNTFHIAGGSPGLKLSWQVTGIRHDAYAEAHRSPVEMEKPAGERGHYLHPELFEASQK